MYLLKDNKLVYISLKEDTTENVLATKSREDLLKEWNKPESIVTDVVYRMTFQ